MDKLKPILDNHFWILLGLVLILPVVGWWPAAGALESEAEKRISDIDSAFSNVPASPSTKPNETWARGVNEIAQVVEEKNQQEHYELWRRQEKMMTWPSRISPNLRPEEYLGEIPSRARTIYKNGYDIDVQNTWKQADPYDIESGEGTVIFPLQAMPREEFGPLPATSKLVWETQEDLWLLESLLKSIRRANSDAKILTDSLVRKINTLELVGGEGDYPDAETSSGSGGTGFGAYGEDYEMMPEEETMFGEGGGGRGRNQISASSASFDPSTEFGEEQGRYIDYSEGTLFKKRGFYLEAVIEHDRLPELLVHLTNGDWPVSIVRVQMAQAGVSTSSSLLGPGGGGGYGEDYEDNYSGMDVEANPYGISGPAIMPEGNYSEYPGGGGLGLGAGNSPEAAENRKLAAAATKGQSLANVAIAGVIYIYNPVEPVETSEEETSSTMEQPADTSEDAPLNEETSESPEAADEDIDGTEEPTDENAGNNNDSPAANEDESPPGDGEAATGESTDGESTPAGSENTDGADSVTSDLDAPQN